MNRLAAAALVVVWMTIPACAQRSAGRGGSSGHGWSGHGSSGQGAPAFHGGVAAPRGSSGFRGNAPRTMTAQRPYRAAGAAAFRRPPYVPPYAPPYAGSGRYRRPYVSPYRTVVAYGAPGWIAPYYLGYPDDSGYDDSAAENSDSASAVSEGYDPQQDEQGPPPWPSIYDQGPVAPAYAPPAPTPEREETVTLIFKDGRAPEQIHNYLLTRETLFVGDRRPSEIPVDQLDLGATVKVNRDAGVEFRLPQGSR